MGAFADYFNTPAPAAPAAPQEETIGDALRKGFDSGTTKAGADLNQLAGLAGENVGADSFTQGRYAAAKAGRERAAAEGPEIDSLSKVNSLNTALRFGAGQLGAMAPVAGAAIAGSLLTRRPFLGGTLGLAPTNVGEVAARQMEDPAVANLPASDRGLRALAGGTAAAAVQNIGPGMFAGKVAGKLAGTEAAALGKQSLSSIMAKNVAEGVGVNAAGSGAGEAITQYAANPDAPFNTDQIKDSAIAGGVMGGAFGVAGGAAEGVRSRGSNISSAVRGAADAVGDKFGAAKDAAVDKFGEAKDAAVEGAGNLKDLAVEKFGETKDLAADAGVEGRKKINSLSDDIGEIYQRGRDSLNETFDKISKDEPLVGLKEFATEAGQKLSDSRAAQAVTDFATRASESVGITPEMRQKLADVAGNATDKTTQLAAVALKKTFDAGVFINTKLTGAYDTLRAGMDAENAKSNVKQSADYSGANRAIAEKLEPMLARREDITQRPDSVNKLVGVMRELASDPSKISVNSDTLTALMDTLGSDTGKMLDAAYGALQKDGPAKPGAAEAFYQKLDEVNTAQKRAGSLKDLIGSSLTDEAKKSVPPSEYGSLAQTLSRVVRGEYGDPNAGPYQRKAQEAQLQSLLTDHFGDKADVVLSRVRKESQLQDKQLSEGETSRGGSLESDKVNEASDAKFDESGNRIGESKNDSRTFGLSEGGRALENGKAVMDPDTFMSTRQEGKNNARQLITDLKVKYPDQDVRFERIPGSDMGHVIVEKAKNSEHFTDGDLKAMEIYKSRDYKNDPGLLEVGGRELDARKIASLAGKKSAGEGRADGTSRAQRLSDTFMDGIARLMEQHGNFSVRDAAVIGEVGGKDFTFGDAMKLQRDSRAEDRMSKAGQKELAALRKLYKTADPEIRDEIIRSVQKLTEKEKNKELAGGDDLGSARSESKPLTRGGLQGPERPGDPTIRPKSEAVEASSGSAQANAMARLTKAHERNQRKYGADAKTDMGEYPFENRDARYDDKGNLTKAGAEELLAGDYNGGIDVNGRSTHERDKTDFKDGEGRTELGKDENISRVMVGDKDAAFTGRKSGDKLRTGEELMKDRSDARPNEDLVSRSNMDGSAKYVSDRPNQENMKPAIGLKNQLLARDEPIATAIANRLGTLIENAGILRESDRFALSKLRADATPDQTQAIINPIARKYADVIMAMKNGKQGEAAVGTVRGADNKNGGFPDLPKQKELQPADKGNPDKEGTPSPKPLAAKKAALLEAASSSDPALIKELSTTDNARGLQRTTVELAKSAPDSKASEVANKRMGELVQDPDTALNLTKKFDKSESGSAKTDTPETRAAVGDYITKTLGDSVKLKFADLTHAGEFERMRLNDVIRLSTTALDPMSTAHHEALHAFFAQLKDAKATDITAVLEKAAASENVIRQLNERYAGNDAVLAQLKDPEERAAYMYQHWAAGDLKIGPQAKNVFTKIADYIRSVMGIWTNDQRATKILEYFNDGEYAKSGRDVGAAREALIEKGHNSAIETAKSFTEPLMKLGDAVLGTGSGRLRDTNIPAIQKIADLIKRNDTDVRGGDQGFISAARIEATKRRGALAEALQGYSPENLKDALQGLQTGQKASTPEGRLAQKVIKNTLKETRDYLVKNGVDVGDLGPDYFPRVWDTHYISKNQQAFKDMLEPHVRRGDLGSSDDLMRSLLSRGGNEFGIEKRTLTEQSQDAAQPYRAAATDRRALDGSAVDVGARPPGFQFKKERSLAFITPQEAAMFVNKDLMGTLNSYIGQATRKAEWTNRLGNGKLEDLLQQAREQGATPDQIKLTDTYLKGVDGTLGDNLNPHARRIMGNLIVYQNLRLLPFAAFSSVVDPAGVAVRGGTLMDAFRTFKRGISEIPESFGRKGTMDHATYMSELVGVVDKAILTGTLGDIYTQGMVGGFAEKANNLFFKANLMEGLNRSFRIGATEAAAKFITRHADGTDSVHSARWIKELGLEPSDIKTTSDGHLALTREDGLSEKQVDRVHAALNQWVDGAVLRPDAADKPIWFNDPHFALISHLKQFTYAFQKVIIGRVVHEYKQGNYAPAMALASYVPIMLAADTAKGLIQGGGDQPDWKKGWDMGDYLGYAVQRGGLLGVGQFGLDIAKDVHRGGTGIGALTGPTIEQFGDAVQLLGGHKQFGPFVLNALPANALYAHAFGKSDVADPMFAD